MTFRRTFASLALVLSAMLFGGGAQAYNELVVFGDSLSDDGNLSRSIFGLLPAKPYYQGRFSNGPVAVEVMADELNIPLVNFAFGGASSGEENRYLPGSATGVLSQIGVFVSQLAGAAKAADADDLYVVWGGGNDLMWEVTRTPRVDMQAVIDVTVNNLVSGVAKLYGAGARDVLIPFMPDMATSYYGTSGRISDSFLTDITTVFNNALRQKLGLLQEASPGLTLRIFDTPTMLDALRADMAAEGADLWNRCWTGEFSGKGTLCEDSTQYYLFDWVHPTAAVHRAVGLALAASVVPEPAAVMLMMCGLLGLGWVARRR